MIPGFVFRRIFCMPQFIDQGGLLMKKLVSLILAVSMLLPLSSVGFAAVVDPDTPQQSNYFNSYGIVMSTPGNGKVVITFSCAGVGTCCQLGVSTYCVQKRNSSGEWVDVTGLLNGKCGYNVSTYTFSKNFYGVAGEYYRVKCVFYCQKGNGSEHKSYTGPIVRAR